MNHFKKARLKLTAWYVGFVMLLSIPFSLGAYRFLTTELEQSLTRQAQRLYARDGILISQNQFIDIYNESRDRIFYNLLILNAGIVLVSGATSYFLAGKTLHPLEKAIDEQKRFIADASHELKTPLTTMRTEVEVALRDKKMTIKDAKELLTSNLEEIDKMKQLTNYLLSLSRYENGEKDLDFSIIRIKDILARSIKLVHPKLEEKSITLKEETEDFALRGNDRSLEELFLILLDNAAKYSNPQTKVVIKSKRIRNYGIIEIKDHGMGIKSSDIPHIFDRFYRADTSRTKQKIEGYGLGLSIAKSIVDLHQGKIEVKSTLGKGTTFKIILPIS